MKIFKFKECVLIFILGALFFIFIFYLIQSVFVIEFDGQILFSKSAQNGQKFSTRFIHSVQKTPVEEFFLIDDDEFILKSTRYQSFGVGLPFLESDGEFRREGNFFVMDNLNRRIKILDLRTGLGTELTLTIDENILPLYEIVPIGSLIRIEIISRHELIKRKFQFLSSAILNNFNSRGSSSFGFE